MKPQNTEERIRFLEHAVEWRQALIDQLNLHHATLQELADTQAVLIDVLYNRMNKERNKHSTDRAAIVANQKIQEQNS